MIIELSASELSLCKFVGEQRSMLARMNGVKDAKLGKQDGTKGDIQGFKAEYAFAKFKNVFPDFGLSVRSGSCDGVTHKGNRYDVKSTERRDGNLLATLKVNPDVDIYVLAVVQYNLVHLIGWARKEILIRPENIKDLGHGKGYILNRDRLNKF